MTQNPFSMTFVLGAPRSGTTMLEHILSANSRTRGGPEPHLMTPLAHLGYWRKVDKAPYDHIVASIGQSAFIESLPHGEEHYWKACRAYCDQLYSAYMMGKNATMCIDKTPEYSTIWPFLLKVFPDAKYIVLTRHPGAIFTSFANSFFDGNFDIAQQHDPVLERYIPALAGMLRQKTVPCFHLRYEDLVAAPEDSVKQLCEYLELPFEDSMIDYGSAKNRENTSGLGDPIGVKRFTRPSVDSVNRWAHELIEDAHKMDLFQSSIDKIDSNDLATVGYPLEQLWQPIENAKRSENFQKRTNGPLRHRLQRKMIVYFRSLAQKSRTTRSTLQWVRLACDVMLREY